MVGGADANKVINQKKIIINIRKVTVLLNFYEFTVRKISDLHILCGFNEITS